MPHIQWIFSTVIGWLAIAAIMTCVALIRAEDPVQNQEKQNAELKPQPIVDITAEVREFNSSKYARPPSKFRPGHVTAKKLDPKIFKGAQKNAAGFVVQLPSKAPVPTPTIYQGRIYVSGGFRSKEYYCFAADSGKLIWAIDLDDDGPSSCVCDDGVCVFNTESCTIFGVDAQSGKLLWSHWLGDPLMSTPTIANGFVFTSYPAAGRAGQAGQQAAANPAGQDAQAAQVKQQAKPPKKAPRPFGKKRPPSTHVLACLALKTGKIVWQRWIDSDVMSAPVAVGDELYATSFSGVVYRFGQADGKIISAHRARATSAPVVTGKDVYYTRRTDSGKSAAEEAIANVARQSGKTKFEANRKAAPHLDAKVQQAAQLAGQGKQLDAANGFAAGAPQAANPAAALGNIGQGGVFTCQAFQGSRILNCGDWNFNCQGGEMACTNAKSGKQRWTLQLKGDLAKVGGALAAPPAMAGGRIFLATLDGKVLRIDPQQGKVEKTYTIGAAVRTQPAVETGRLYVGTQTGQLVCIQLSDKRFGGWPTWGGNAAHTGVADSQIAKR